MTDIVSIQNNTVHAPLVKFMVQRVCDSALPGATQARKPDYTALVAVKGLPVASGYLMFMPGDIRIIAHYRLLVEEIFTTEPYNCFVDSVESLRDGYQILQSASGLQVVLPTGYLTDVSDYRHKARTREAKSCVIWLQPFLLHTGNLQVLSLFGQLSDPVHGRFKPPPVTVNDTYSNCCPLPFVLKGDLCNGGIETGTQTIFQAAHGSALVLQGTGPGNHQFDGEQ